MFPFNVMTWFKIAVIATALAFSYWKGYSGEHEKFLKFKAEVEAIGKAQEIANQNAAEMAEVITEGVKDEYETRIAALRRQYAGRVQQCNSSSGAVSTVPKSSPSVAGSADDPAIIGLCAEETAKLVALQKWVKKQSEAHK